MSIYLYIVHVVYESCEFFILDQQAPKVNKITCKIHIHATIACHNGMVAED